MSTWTALTQTAGREAAEALTELAEDLTPEPVGTGIFEIEDGRGRWEVGLYFTERPDELALALMAAAWAGGAATSLNPAGGSASFDGQLADVRAGRLGGVFNGNGAVMAQRMQTVALRESRLKIPLLFAADVIHGLRTVFPVPLAEAASFDPELVRRTARAAGASSRAARNCRPKRLT